MNTTTIEWATHTWNPVTGCTPVSEGCENCYAKRMAQRLRGRYGYPEDEPFKVTFHPNRLKEPLKLRKPSRIFVCSMGDILHDNVEPVVLAMILDIVSRCPQHTFLVLTKRPERMVEDIRQNAMIAGWFKKPLPNLWWGVTVENNDYLWRIAHLLQIPAAVRFVSVEPMLGPVGLNDIGFDGVRLKAECFCDSPRSAGLDWVICGGETGPGARPMHPDWVRSLRDQCRAARVPFLFKQWGEWRPMESTDSCPLDKVGYWYRGWRPFTPLYSADGHSFTIGVSPWGAHMAMVGRRTAGRLLDGEIWDEYPEEKA